MITTSNHRFCFFTTSKNFVYKSDWKLKVDFFFKDVKKNLKTDKILFYSEILIILSRC